jgi:hypothetical protein
VKVDPTVGVENPPRRKGEGFVPWTEEHVWAFERRWPIGTRQRLWLDVLLYTGLRRGDAVRFGRQHVREGVGSLKSTPPVRTAGQVRDDRLPADFRDERFASAETSSTSDSVSTALGSKSSAIHSVSSAWRSC